MKATLDEERRCQVGLHNFVFFDKVYYKDETKECMKCKTCDFFILPTNVEPRVCHVHDEGLNTNKT